MTDSPRTYIIEQAREHLWVLRRLGQYETIASGPSAESVLEQAFSLVSPWVPVRIRILGEDLKEWRLDHPLGQWEEVELEESDEDEGGEEAQ